MEILETGIIRNGKLTLPKNIQTHLKVKPRQYVMVQQEEDRLVLLKMNTQSIPIRSDLYDFLEAEARLQHKDPVTLLDDILQGFLMEMEQH